MDLTTMENSFQFQLLGELTNDASLSVSDVLARFIKYELEKTTFYTDEDHLWAWETCYCLLQVAKRTSSTEKLDKLVAFVVELQKVKAYNPTTGKQAKNSEWYIWSDLPQFAWAGGDELEFGKYLL
ncbi:hypothetical protein VHEMI04515 [[Torrubiella] hemipterigena]|uniref:Uncharacterized protein n=1 Tax=[Torrubiella] hemipterigena TaxID=1531966 RepID=A0A0A1TGI8_9HYPO|nr:hypothetical protein VHEMI04515 [[Torrubiella] hemipterigena]